MKNVYINGLCPKTLRLSAGTSSLPDCDYIIAQGNPKSMDNLKPFCKQFMNCNIHIM